jgi:uncharacterized repeat protein (TIGR01451 family)
MHISELLRASVRGVLCVTLTLISISLSAQSSPGVPAPVQLTTTAGLVVETIAERRIADSSDALAKLAAADELHIGDEIIYTLRVWNRTDAAIDSAVIVKAVPRNTVYVADSAVGPATDIDYSVDGGYRFARPEDLVMSATADARPAQSSDYTHLRWRLRHPLASGATALLRFRGVFR